MFDITQTLLVIVITVLTILLAVIGIQMVYILRDFRKSLKKADKILEDTSELTASIRRPVGSLSSIVNGIKAGVEVMRVFREKNSESNKKS